MRLFRRATDLRARARNVCCGKVAAIKRAAARMQDVLTTADIHRIACSRSLKQHGGTKYSTTAGSLIYPSHGAQHVKHAMHLFRMGFVARAGLPTQMHNRQS